MNRSIVILHWLMMALLNGAMLLSFYLYFLDAPNPIVMNNLPFQVDKEVYRHGDTILVEFDVCKPYSRHLSPVIRILFVDGLVFETEPIYFNGLSTGCKKSGFPVAVPKTLPPGEYHIQATNSYQVNFLRERVVEWSTVSFNIIP